MQVILNKREKVDLVVKLHQEDKTIRQIAEIVHMSFKDIGAIIRRMDGLANDDNNDIAGSNKSKATQALFLYEQGKKPIDVAIELDIPYTEVEELQQEYWALKELGDLALVYYEIRNDLDLFLRLFHVMKKLRLINQKDIQTMLRSTAFDIPSLESKIQRLTSDVIDLEWRKKQSKDEISILNSSISQLKKSLNRYKIEIEDKKQIISNLNRQLNQKSIALSTLVNK